jgi:mannan endo-1,4-beta-mannosidase
VKTRYLIVVIIAAGLLEYGLVSLVGVGRGTSGGGSTVAAAASGGSKVAAAASGGSKVAGGSASPSAPPPFDVGSLVTPARKYLGVTIQGAPDSMAPIDAFAQAIGKKPNIVEFYESFDDNFDASGVRKIYQYGSLPLLSWEPLSASMAKIAAGSEDAYLKTFAKAVRTLNLPVAIALAHEMNGRWYSWGPQKTKAADFVAAWRHVHDVFVAAGATNVIWVWAPNVINPVPRVHLAPLYPGDAYVDWVGMDGYYTHKGQQTFTALFGPTMTAVRRFTKKPILIVETGAEPGAARPGEIANLFDGVAHTPGLIGFVWFDNRGTGSWRIDNDARSVTAFRRAAKASTFGFDVHG